MSLRLDAGRLQVVDLLLELEKGRQIKNMRPYGCLFLMTPDMQELVALTQLNQVLPSQWAKIINSTYKYYNCPNNELQTYFN